MSTQKLAGRHAQAKTPGTLTRASATVAVTGGLVAGLAATGGSSAGAATPSAQQEAIQAATTPLELKTVTPAKSLVAAKPQATVTKKAATSVSLHRASRTKARQALTHRSPQATQRLEVQRKAAAERQAARAAAAKEREGRQQVSRTHTRRTLTQHVAPQRHQVRTQTATQHRTTDRASQTATQHRRTQRATATQHRPTQRATTTQHRTRQYTVTPAATRTTTQRASSGSVSTSGVLGIASRYTGIRYSYGGSSPATGLDCSGFVSLVYKQLGVSLPHSSGAIRAMTTPVSDPRPGDLVFLPGHVGIYAGNGMVYEARNYGSLSGLYPVLPGSTYGRL